MMLKILSHSRLKNLSQYLPFRV